MARIDKRARATGRLGVKRGERYALVPEEVMNSMAYSVQPDYAKCVLFALACRCNGHNNGNLSLPFTEAKQLGIAAQWKLYAGLRLLTIAQLTQRTRKGSAKGGRKYANLYALDWRGIDAVDGLQYDCDINVCPLPRNAWARWEVPANWRETVKQVATVNHGQSKILRSTTLGNGRSTTLGNEEGSTAQPCWGMETPFTVPSVGVPSKILVAAHTANPPAAASDSKSRSQSSRLKPLKPERVRGRGQASERNDPDLDRRVGKLIGLQPHLTDREIGRIFGIESARIAAIRESLTRSAQL